MSPEESSAGIFYKFYAYLGQWDTVYMFYFGVGLNYVTFWSWLDIFELLFGLFEYYWAYIQLIISFSLLIGIVYSIAFRVLTIQIRKEVQTFMPVQVLRTSSGVSNRFEALSYLW